MAVGQTEGGENTLVVTVRRVQDDFKCSFLKVVVLCEVERLRGCEVVRLRGEGQAREAYMSLERMKGVYK